MKTINSSEFILIIVNVFKVEFYFNDNNSIHEFSLKHLSRIVELTSNPFQWSKSTTTLLKRKRELAEWEKISIEMDARYHFHQYSLVIIVSRYKKRQVIRRKKARSVPIATTFLLLCTILACNKTLSSNFFFPDMDSYLN